MDADKPEKVKRPQQVFTLVVEVGRKLVDQPDHLHVVHVLIDLAPLEAGEVWGVVDVRARAEQAEKSLREKLAASHLTGVRSSVLIGEPAHSIVLQHTPRPGGGLGEQPHLGGRL